MQHQNTVHDLLIWYQSLQLDLNIPSNCTIPRYSYSAGSHKCPYEPVFITSLCLIRLKNEYHH